MGHKTPTVSKLVIRGMTQPGPSPHVYVSGDGILSTGDQQQFPSGTFIVTVSPTITNEENFHASLKRIVRNSLSAYPIVEVEDGGGLPFDLKVWLREHKADL